ncbi:MAG: DegT/DnrJ/EryC1/StrS family aminotransferase [Byssovorax sp.]
MKTAPVPFFDRTRGDAAIEGELTAAFQRVLRSGRYILGPEVEAFEGECARALGVRHAVGVSSGSDAVLAALMALRVGPGDEVICPAYTFFATAGAIARLGATPVFADIDPSTYLVDLASVAERLSPRTRAIVPVHLFGRCVDIDALRALTPLPVVEDAAQAFGARDPLGRSAGAVGALGCFSFFPTKNLGGFGDGGLVVTGDDALAARVRSLRAHGAPEKNHHTDVGGNFRLDALQAALLRVTLPRVDAAIAARREHAARYDTLLGEAGLHAVIPPQPDGRATYNQYVIRVLGAGVRDRLRTFLLDRGAGTEVYYPVALPRQPCFAGLDHAVGSFPGAEAAARETLALPVFPELGAAEITIVVEKIKDFFRGAE